MTLNGKWKLYYYPCDRRDIQTVADVKAAQTASVAAQVPGNVELDLSNAGILPADLFKGMNIVKAEAYETYDWWYEKRFVAPPAIGADEKAVLYFGGVDCAAEYFLNGEKIGESCNMLIAHEFDVTGKLLYGAENELHVHIRSAVLETASQEIEPNELAYTWHVSPEALNIRKAPHMYGWDIMPRAVSAGLWRDVELRVQKKCGFRYLYFTTKALTEAGARVDLIYDGIVPDAMTCAKFTCRVHIKCADHEAVFEKREKKSGRFEFTVKDARLWWPKPYGAANLYEAEVALVDDAGNAVISEKTRFGIRTLQLKRSEIVKNGGSFEFIINGKRIMAVGSNWVPLDAYHSRDRERYPKAFQLVDDIGVNILRCWGGNVYEDSAFFDFMDEHGVMVWQDFGMACTYYPQNEGFFAKIAAEAESVVKKLRQHPSIVLWSGDNEIDSMLAMSAGVDPSINRITREILPRVVERFDPYRPYIASSPYISPEAFHGGDNRQGSKIYPEDHLWGPRDYFKSNFYTEAAAYFVSEMGYHGCPSMKSIKRFIDEDHVWPYFDNEQWNLHSSDQDNSSKRVMLMHRQVMQLFGKVPEDPDDYALASQISQAEAKKFFVEHMRARMSRNGGVIWWNLLDGWPQMSDAVVDYFFEKKLAYAYIRRSQKPFIIMMDELDSWGQELITCNSTLNTVEGYVKVYDLDTGEVFADTEFCAAPNANTVILKIPMMYSDKRMLAIEWTANGENGFNTYLCGKPGFDFETYKRWIGKIEKAEEAHLGKS